MLAVRSVFPCACGEVELWVCSVSAPFFGAGPGAYDVPMVGQSPRHSMGSRLTSPGRAPETPGLPRVLWDSAVCGARPLFCGRGCTALCAHRPGGLRCPSGRPRASVQHGLEAWGAWERGSRRARSLLIPRRRGTRRANARGLFLCLSLAIIGHEEERTEGAAVVFVCCSDGSYFVGQLSPKGSFFPFHLAGGALGHRPWSVRLSHWRSRAPVQHGVATEWRDGNGVSRFFLHLGRAPRLFFLLRLPCTLLQSYARDQGQSSCAESFEHGPRFKRRTLFRFSSFSLQYRVLGWEGGPFFLRFVLSSTFPRSLWEPF